MNAASTFALIGAALSGYVALLSARFARAPGWEEQRWFAFTAASSAAYQLCDSLVSMDLPADATLLGARVQWLWTGLSLLGWLRYAAAFENRPLNRIELALAVTMVVAGVSGLVPGVAFTGEISTHTFAPLDVTYHDVLTSTWGTVVLPIFPLTMLWVTVRFAMAWRRGVPHAGLNFLGIATLMATALCDALVIERILDLPFLVDLGFLFSVGVVGYQLTARFVASARDLATLRTRLEDAVTQRTRELSQTQQQLHTAEKLAAIGQLAAGVAHEINNPAGAVAANLSYLTENLAAGALPDDAMAALTDSRLAVDRIAGVVRKLLDSSRLARASKPEVRPVSVSKMVAEALTLAKPKCGAVTLVDSVPAGLWVQGEEQALVQVLVNLIVNGAQAVPVSRADGRVEVSAARSAGKLMLEVRDNGSGMTDEVLRRAFEPFFSTRPFGVGTGLGLAVSRGLVLSVGGVLELDSTPGRGTRAIVTLDERAAPQVPVVLAQRTNGPRRSVLLVEDEPSVLEALRRQLGREWDVTVATGPTQALTLVERGGDWDVVVCDVMMPDGGGARVFNALAAAQSPLARRLVFLTGGATTAEAREFLASQPQPVLHKPLDLEELTTLAASFREQRLRALAG